MFDPNQNLLPTFKKICIAMLIVYGVLLIDHLLPTRQVKATFVEYKSERGVVKYSTNTVLFDRINLGPQSDTVIVERSLLLGIAKNIKHQEKDYPLRTPKGWYGFLYALPVLLSLIFFYTKNDDAKHITGFLNGVLFLFSIILVPYLLLVYNL